MAIVQTQRRIAILTTGVAAAFALAIGMASPAHAAPSDAKAQTIDVDNGESKVYNDQTITYTVKVKSTEKAAGKIRLNLPLGARFVEADKGGKADKSAINWKVDFAKGKTVTVKAEAKLDSVPADTKAVAAVSCVIGANDIPTVCDNDVDQLAEGKAPVDKDAASDSDDDGNGWVVWLVIAAIVVIAAVLAFLLVRRRNTDMSGSGTPNVPKDPKTPDAPTGLSTSFEERMRAESGSRAGRD